jgi:hypothetical protein
MERQPTKLRLAVKLGGKPGPAYVAGFGFLPEQFSHCVLQEQSIIHCRRRPASQVSQQTQNRTPDHYDTTSPQFDRNQNPEGSTQLYTMSFWVLTSAVALVVPVE